MTFVRRQKGVAKYLLYDKIGRLLRPYCLNKLERRRLKNHDFTIFSQNCIGSIMYHDLGAKFLSPTINMKFNPNDWIKFLADIRYYLDAPISFCKDNRYSYPIGYIGDCFVEFVHYSSENEVIQKWEERKSRINWNNFFVISCDKDMTINSVKKYYQLHKRMGGHFIMFVSENTYLQLTDEEIDSGIYIKQRFFPDGSDAKLLNFASIFGHRYYNYCFDYIKFLNNG